jgi:isopentenyldiphosphate isomerase
MIESADYTQVHSEGLLHRFVSIFVLEEAGKLLQKRSWSKPHGSLFSESVSAHITYGENYFRLLPEGLEKSLRVRHPPFRIKPSKVLNYYSSI